MACVPLITDPFEFPQRHANRPGLPRIGYRIGRYAEFVEAIMRGIDAAPELASWTHREPDDPAIALAQGIALALDRPLVPVSTLAVLAAQVPPPPVTAGEGGCDIGLPRPILAAIDARMGEIYTGTFVHRGDRLQATSGEAVVAPADYALVGDDGGWIGVGTGFVAGDGVLATRLQSRFARIDAQALPHAADLARLAADAFARGDTVTPEHVEPAYLRNNVALTLEEQKALRASRA